MKFDDLIITAAYVWIPLQAVVALSRYPRLVEMPTKIWGLLLLVGLFFILCGAGHFLRAVEYHQEHDLYRLLNWMTAIVSFVAALYSLPLVPVLVDSLDLCLQDLVRLCEETAESKRKLLTFMSFLCHEIRNPLFAITSALSFLQEEDTLTEEQEQTVDTIRQSAELMLRLVNDVLDLSKLESGRLEMEERTFDLIPLLEGVIATAGTQIRRKHYAAEGGAVVFQSSIASDVPHAVRGDSVRLLQIVYNLLSNANKFTERGVIRFSVSALQYSQAVRDKLVLPPLDDADADNKNSPGEPPAHASSGADTATTNTTSQSEPDEFATSLLQAAETGQCSKEPKNDSNTVVLSFTVQDTGIGIAPDRVEEIFQPYSQAKMSDYREHGGTGLGLSIISKLTQIMGGTIQVSSQEYEGSSFVVHLPMRKCLGGDRNDVMDPSPLEAKQEATSNGGIGKPSRSHDLLCAPSLDAEPLVCTADSVSMPIRAKKLGQASPKPTKKASMPPLDLPKGSNMVLVVDDNEMNRKLIGRMLANFHVEYESAGNGQEALDIIAKSCNATGDPDAPRYGLVLMDMQMPIMDGVEAIERLRAQQVEVPIIALTANALDEWRQNAMQAGATDFETKPILRDRLYAKCRQYLLTQPS